MIMADASEFEASGGCALGAQFARGRVQLNALGSYAPS
jgi:hypothetical protein